MKLTKADVYNNDGTLTARGHEVLAYIKSKHSEYAWEFVGKREDKTVREMVKAYDPDSAVKLNTITQRVSRSRRQRTREETFADSGIPHPELVRYFGLLPEAKREEIFKTGGYFAFYKLARQPWRLQRLEATDDDGAIAAFNKAHDNILWEALRQQLRKTPMTGEKVLGGGLQHVVDRIEASWESASVHYFKPEVT